MLAASLLLGSLSAYGQGADKAAAESLFQAGKALLAEGKYAEACSKFVESQRIDPSVGTLLNLGKCYELQGRSASAWAEYKEAAALARRTGQADREAAAKKLTADLEPKLSKLRVDAAPGVASIPGLSMVKDGEAMGTGSLGIPIFTDPGEHTLEVSAPGYAPWSTKVTLGKDGDAQTITIPPLEKAAGPAPETTSPLVGPSPGTPETAPAAHSSGPNTMRTAGFILGGVGVVGLGVGAITGIMAASDASGAEDDPALCPNKVCSAAGKDEIDGAKGKATISTIGFVVGAAALTAGVVLVIVAPSKTEAAASNSSGKYAGVVPNFDSRGGGFSMLGRF